MQQLIKYKLDFDPTWKYFKENLDNVNALSSELLNLLNFKNGYFFTLLPDNANFKNIYHFKEGLILPQNPIQTQIINGNRLAFSWTPNIDNELSQLILKEISSNPQFSCIMDNVLGAPEDKNHPCYSDNYTLFYDDEIYSLLNNNISYDLISLYLRYSHTIWHSLCVLTKADFSNFTKTINLEKIKEICLKTELVIVGAYDGEGYVFWEKNLTNGSKGFFEECT